MNRDNLFYLLYDEIFSRKDYRSEIKTALQLALSSIRSPATILEIGSGTGSHTSCCAESGHNVVGIDIDPVMVEIAKKKLRSIPDELKERIKYFNCPVEDLEMSGFDAALALFNVVNYFHELASLESFMKATCKRIKNGSSFVFDAWNGVAAILDQPRRKETLLDGTEHLIKVTVIPQTDIMSLKCKLSYELEVRSKKTDLLTSSSYTIDHTLWPARIIEEVATGTGFEEVSIFPKDDLKRKASEKDWNILFHCRKK